MGLLTTGGAPMRWGTDANNQAIPHVTEHGIRQFLNVYKTRKDADNAPFLWGEELEHLLIHAQDGKVTLALDAAEVMERLSKRPDNNAVWHPEYGSFMVESTPDQPYTLTIGSLHSVEESMKTRYELIDKESEPGTFGALFVTFPHMGVGQFTFPEASGSPHSCSLFVPDLCINRTHPRFVNLTENIRLRRGRKVCIQVPLFMDTNTLANTVDKKLNIDKNPRNNEIDCGVVEKKKTTKFGASEEEEEEVEPSSVTSPTDAELKQHPNADALTHLFTPATMYYYGQYFTDQQRENVKKRYDACPCPVPSVSHPCIYMDCMAFGMGSCCLQVTMQLKNIRQARHVYDQLAILCPAFLAITSSTPFQKGLLCDSDVRWLTIAASVDDRRREEVPRIIKSRYDSISVFISPEPEDLNQFNDSQIEINESFMKVLTENGVDDRLARHISHLFIRDPLVMYDQMIDIDDTTHTEHFENIQSTNWQTVRFKPPPVGADIGWRVEFRVMDIMPTPFENAVFSVFIPLLTSAIIKYGAVFYTKMSVVDQNMGRAHHINPCNEKYMMRKDIFSAKVSADDSESELMSIDEIFNGRENGYYGLIPLVRRYLKDEGKTTPKLERYLSFLSQRASGKLPTAAQYMRNYIMKHPDYKHDSRLSDAIAHDITMHMRRLATEEEVDDQFIPAALLGHRKRQRDADDME